MYRKFVVLCALGALLCVRGYAQKTSLGVNVADVLMLGTVNARAEVAVSRHWTVQGEAKYNPFSFGSGEKSVNLRRQEYYSGVRYWPWHVFSGWWMSALAGYQEYNFGGIFSSETREGDRFGAGIGGGYTYMLNPHLNVEFGAGVWAGRDKYAIYECPVCGFTKERGQTFFILPSEIVLALTYVF